MALFLCLFCKKDAYALGAVTLIGMAIVLLMANTIPPILFRLYTKCGGKIK